MLADSKIKQLTGIHYATGEAITVTVGDGCIMDMKPLTSQQDDLPMIGPGLVDLQINGYDGDDFSSFPMDSDRVVRVTRKLWKEGVTTYFPTVTTNTDACLKEAMTAIAKACRDDKATEAGIAGIHLEGPFLSPEDGPRGAHSLSYIQAPDWDLFQGWQDAAEGRIRLLTISPEWPESPQFIAKCTESGVIVSIGHTAATPEQIREAVSAGARMSTHFGNGAHLMLPRHPNYLWEQLAQEELWCCLIGDGFHLPDSFIKVAMKVKGNKAMLISDGNHLCGMPPGEYHSHKRIYVVKTPEGKLHLRDNPGILAGSAQMLPWGIGRLAARGVCTLTEAWEMASVRPAGFVGLPVRQGLAIGAPADLVLFTQEGHSIRILQVYKNGVLSKSEDST